MKDVRNTIYGDYFSLKTSGEVMLLDEDEAKEACGFAFASKASSFFNLPDSHWIFSANEVKIGTWLDAYNTKELEPVKSNLSEAVSWENGKYVYFIVSSSVVFRTSWIVFLSSWHSFLAYEDDAPILMQDLKGREAVIFTPLGDILLFRGR